jgi:restriction system protein
VTLLEAVLQVLTDAGEPLHYREITDRIMAAGWQTEGKTPWATVNARLATDINQHGSSSKFMRTAPGVFALNDGSAPDPQPKSKDKLTFLESAKTILTEEADKSPMHYKAITSRALQRGLLDTQGLTPEATMYAQIVTHINRAAARGDVPVFTKAGKGLVGLTEWEGAGVRLEIKRHNDEVRKDLLRLVRQMDPAEFEEMLGRLLAEMGFEEIEVTKYHGDKGIDLRGRLLVTGGIPIRMAIQAKRWKNPVQSPEIQKVRGASSANERAMIITTSSFGSGARAEAEREGFPPVGLIDGTDLVGLMIEYRVGVNRSTVDVIDLDESGL